MTLGEYINVFRGENFTISSVCGYSENRMGGHLS